MSSIFCQEKLPCIVKCISQAYSKNAVSYELYILPGKTALYNKNLFKSFTKRSIFHSCLLLQMYTNLISKRQELHSDFITVLRGLYFEVETFHNIFFFIFCLQHLYAGVYNT
jgi:hypothetical protein